jgi:[ribosomal protein S5]-alanine N-acetyltransferase
MDPMEKIAIEISTERLWLKELVIENHEFIRELVNTQGWLTFIGDRKVHSAEDSVNYIQKIRSMPNTYYWVVHLADSQLPVGIITFMKREYLEHFDLGFAFLPTYQSNCYAYEAASAVAGHLHHAGYTIILATTLPDNQRSIGLLWKLGFHFKEEMEFGDGKLHVYSKQPG